MIVESNDDVDKLSKYLSSKVVLLREKYPNSQLLPKLRNFYDVVIIPWMEEFQLTGVEVDRELDEELKNKILDRINWINRILNK